MATITATEALAELTATIKGTTKIKFDAFAKIINACPADADVKSIKFDRETFHREQIRVIVTISVTDGAIDPDAIITKIDNDDADRVFSDINISVAQINCKRTE
ncbi:hypothetical protein [uncultured Duncaniella sp.]|uniref:hypothetical protein n=1 Tax=uncultured Duncaniella sp. TaxID=2768039 RepID=UPI00261FC964|nr:hypothetical protein [uncultured Duncaniella sp.]